MSKKLTNAKYRFYMWLGNAIACLLFVTLNLIETIFDRSPNAVFGTGGPGGRSFGFNRPEQPYEYIFFGLIFIFCAYKAIVWYKKSKS